MPAVLLRTSVLILGLAVATLGCKGKPKNLGPTRDVHSNTLVVRVAGPFELEATDTIYAGFMTVENRSSDAVYASLDGCGVFLEPGERRGCYPLSSAQSRNGPPIQSTTQERRVSLKLEEMSLERSGPGRARFTAFVRNTNGKNRYVAARVRFDVVD